MLVSVGEVLVDLLSVEPAASLSEVQSFSRMLGGAPANVAVTAAALGYPSSVIGKVGDDGFGQFVRRELQRLGVDDRWIAVDTERPTTVVAVTRTVDTPDFVAWRGADAELVAGDVPQQLDVRAIHTSAFALSREPSRAAVITALQRAREAGALVSVDVNYSQRIWTEDPAPTLRKALALADTVKVSADDLKRLDPSLSVSQHVRAIHDLGPTTVVVTGGAAGASLSRGGDFDAVPAPAVDVVDVTGAGDALCAGYLVAVLEGLEPIDALRSGVAVAARKVQTVGPLHRQAARSVIES